jgi:hypothetical protein
MLLSLMEGAMLPARRGGASGNRLRGRFGNRLFPSCNGCNRRRLSLVLRSLSSFLFFFLLKIKIPVPRGGVLKFTATDSVEKNNRSKLRGIKPEDK